MNISHLNDLIDLAKKQNTKRLAVAAADDKFVLNAILKAKELGLIAPIFIGKKEKIEQIADELNLSVESDEIIDSPDPEQACIQSVQWVREGKADLLMKGLVSTGVLLKQVVSKEFGLVENNLLSHLAIFESPYYHKLLGVTDAAMNIAPDVGEKASILKNAVGAFHRLGVETPLVAILAAIEKVNPKMSATTEADLIKSMNTSGDITGCLVDGPLALDNAISEEAAEHKGIISSVAGNADILLTPNIESGNILYKSLSFLGNARCAAVILGASNPIILTSRADSEETKLMSIILGVALA